MTETPELSWTARFNNGNGGASIHLGGRSVFVSGSQARALAVALVGPMQVGARASIVAFLAAEAARLVSEADSAEVSGPPSRHLYTQAAHARAWAEQIARGDDVK